MSNSSVATRVPLEIYDQIYDHLDGDRAALGSCGLTCRSWLPAVRTRMFKSVNLTLKTTPGFKSIVEAHPEVGFCVRTLTLHAPADTRFEILPYLPNVTRLVLQNWILRHQVNPALAGCLTKVRDMELHSFDVTPSELPRFIAACRELSSLTIRAVFWPITYVRDTTYKTLADLPADVLAIEPEQPVRVDSLSVWDCHDLASLFLARKTVLAPVRQVMFSWYMICSAGGRSILHSAGTALEHLVVDFQTGRSYLPLNHKPLISSLKANTSLVSFTIKHLRVPPSFNSVMMNWLLDILPTIQSSRLCRLRIEMDIYDRKTFADHIPWRRLDELFEQLATRSRGVEFSIVFNVESRAIPSQRIADLMKHYFHQPYAAEAVVIFEVRNPDPKG